MQISPYIAPASRRVPSQKDHQTHKTHIHPHTPHIIHRIIAHSTTIQRHEHIASLSLYSGLGCICSAGRTPFPSPSCTSAQRRRDAKSTVCIHKAHTKCTLPWTARINTKRNSALVMLESVCYTAKGSLDGLGVD